MPQTIVPAACFIYVGGGKREWDEWRDGGQGAWKDDEAKPRPTENGVKDGAKRGMVKGGAKGAW